MNENIARRIGLIAMTVLAFVIGLILVVMPSEQRNYEVHGADGKVYRTTSIAHGTGRIWFTDEYGNRIELGGGYSVIEK